MSSAYPTQRGGLDNHQIMANIIMYTSILLGLKVSLRQYINVQYIILSQNIFPGDNHQKRQINFPDE